MEALTKSKRLGGSHLEAAAVLLHCLVLPWCNVHFHTAGATCAMASVAVVRGHQKEMKCNSTCVEVFDHALHTFRQVHGVWRGDYKRLEHQSETDRDGQRRTETDNGCSEGELGTTESAPCPL